jgi:sterol desaturase/sphingolipid hydroxylase (fatty acid hydroxylase superfamily)
MADLRFWKNEYRLDRMSLKELTQAYFIYPAIIVYILIGIAGIVLAALWAEGWTGPVLAALAVVFAYPLIWYVLHRWVLHSQLLYKFPLTARAWKRIHFDHHRDPNDLSVLFGALYTTLPTIAAAALPIGWLIAGPAGAAAAMAAGVLMTCFYEYCHCIQHLNYMPEWEWLKRIKARHMAHHFHDETTNFGITSFAPDRLFGTYAPSPEGRARSETVFNLGYTGEQVRRYPWVARMTPDIDEERAAAEGVQRRRPPRERKAAGA